MTVKLEKRFSDGVQFLGAYTWGHALTDVGSPLSEGPGIRTVHISEEYAHASFDVRHRFVLSGQWELPVGKNLTGVARTIVSDWQLNGILTLQTGNYMSIGSSRGVCSCSGDIRPDVVSGKDPNAVPSGGGFRTRPSVRSGISATTARSGRPLGRSICRCSRISGSTSATASSSAPSRST
jgi:hypothetical protein